MPTSARSRASDHKALTFTNEHAIPGGPADVVATPSLCDRADALYRAATECCRQHERVARLFSGTASEAEQKAACTIVDTCDQLLADLTAAYERKAARVHPDGEDEAWWHRANALWHASREYARRHRGCDRAGRDMAGAQHSSDMLASLNIEYELEASALLALKHATEAYRKVRPEAA